MLAQPSFSCMATGSSSDAGWAFLWLLKATWVMAVNTDPGCGGTKDPDRTLVAAWAHTLPCPWVAGCLPVSACASSPLLHAFYLFPQHVNHSVCLSLPFLHYAFAHHKYTLLPGPTCHWVDSGWPMGGFHLPEPSSIKQVYPLYLF